MKGHLIFKKFRKCIADTLCTVGKLIIGIQTYMIIIIEQYQLFYYILHLFMIEVAHARINCHDKSM